MQCRGPVSQSCIDRARGCSGRVKCARSVLGRQPDRRSPRPRPPTSFSPCRTERSRPSPRPCSRRPVRSPRPPPPRVEPAPAAVDLVVAATTDIHGRVRGWNYDTDRPDSLGRPRARGDDRRLAAAQPQSRPRRARRRGRHHAGQRARLRRGAGRARSGADARHRRDERDALRRGRGRQSRLQLRRRRTSSGTSARRASPCWPPTSAAPTAGASSRLDDGRAGRGEDRHRRRDDARLDGVGSRQSSRGAGRHRRHRAGGAPRRGFGARRGRGRRRRDDAQRTRRAGDVRHRRRPDCRATTWRRASRARCLASTWSSTATRTRRWPTRRSTACCSSRRRTGCRASPSRTSRSCARAGAGG